MTDYETLWNRVADRVTADGGVLHKSSLIEEVRAWQVMAGRVAPISDDRPPTFDYPKAIEASICVSRAFDPSTALVVRTADCQRERP